ncbi:hypothetical protein N2152v2_011149 [Parachlorella kessleri]
MAAGGLLQLGRTLLSPLTGTARWYNNTAQAHPFTTGVITTGLKTSAADFFAQKVIEGRKEIDWTRHAVFVTFGFAYLGGFQYYLYNVKFTQWCGAITQTFGHRATAPIKTAIDQFIHHPLLYFPTFFAMKAVVSGKPLSTAADKYRAEIWDSLKALWSVWVPAQLVNFAFVPRHLRVPYVAAVSFGWTVILSVMQGKFDAAQHAKQAVPTAAGAALGAPAAAGGAAAGAAAAAPAGTLVLPAGPVPRHLLLPARQLGVPQVAAAPVSVPLMQQQQQQRAVAAAGAAPVAASAEPSKCFKDKSFVRWPPHINLLYPFWEDTADNFAQAAKQCSEALQAFGKFQVKLSSLGYFDHGRSCTLWLDPESPELCRLQAALVEAFPDCSDLSLDPSRGITRFTPHLSLGQWRGSHSAAAAVQEYGAAWAAEEFEAHSVALISRQGFDDPFTIRYLVGLGGGPVREVNLPYVSTLGPPLPEPAAPAAAALGSHQHGQAGDFGLIPWQQGVWNFAYGANMCPSKVEGARGLRPLQSLPASLPGWRLSFTHRGGMGNLVRVDAGAAGDGGSVHGVLHLLSHSDWAKLANMEHEYRYMGLLREGARHWALDPAYKAWLDGLPTTDPRQRGSDYYTSAAGTPLPALPKIRTGSRQQAGGRGGGRRERGRGRGGRQAPNQTQGKAVGSH